MKKLNKHFMTITNNKKISDARRILKGVHFNPKINKIEATDAYRLLRWKQEKEIKQEMTLNLETLELIDLDFPKYPDTEILIPKKYAKATFELGQISSDMVSKLTKNKNGTMLRMKIDKNYLYITVADIRSRDTDILSMSILFNEPELKSDVFYCNTEYMRDLFQFLLDYKKEYKDETIEFGYVSPITPFLFKSDKFEYLMTPIIIDG